MTTYSIQFPFSAETENIVIGNNTVLQAPYIFKRFIGAPWSEFITTLESLGIVVIPIINTSHVDRIEVKDTIYSIHWNHDHSYIKRILKSQDNNSIEIQFGSLPALIKNALL